MIDYFFLHTFWPPAFGFNVEVAIFESRSYTLTSAILNVDVVCDVAMMTTPNVLTTELHDLLYNQCIDNTCCYSIFIYPTGRIRVCKIRFVSTGENRGKSCLVCKNIRIFHEYEVQIEKSVRWSLFGVTRLRRVIPKSDLEWRIFLSEPNKYDVCDVKITSTPNILTTELRGLLYNQCMDDTCYYLFFVYPTGRIRV